MSTTTYAATYLKNIDTGCYNGIRRSLAGPSTVRGADASVESVWGRRSRPNEPQRKSDTETRVDPKTSPVPRLEGNPTFVPKGSSFEEPFGRWPLEGPTLNPAPGRANPGLGPAKPAQAVPNCIQRTIRRPTSLRNAAPRPATYRVLLLSVAFSGPLTSLMVRPGIHAW